MSIGSPPPPLVPPPHCACPHNCHPTGCTTRHVAHILQYLKPGGHFLASFEVERPELDNDILVMGVRKNIRTPETVRHMLEEAGFDVLHADLEECAYLWVDEIDDQRVPIPYLMVAARRQEE